MAGLVFSQINKLVQVTDSMPALRVPVTKQKQPTDEVETLAAFNTQLIDNI